MKNISGKTSVDIAVEMTARPSLEKWKSSFSIIRQGKATNNLTKTIPRIDRNATLDEITGAVKISSGDFSVTIDEFTKQLSGLKTSTYKLLDALTVVMTETGKSSVSLPLTAYMEMCGLKDKKEVRKQVNNDLEMLFNIKLSFKGRDNDYLDLRVCDAKGIKNSIIGVSFTHKFFELLMSYPVMPYPNQLFKLNSQYNPNSYYFLRKISEHKNMNYGKSNADIISVMTLLNETPFLPSYDEVIQTDRHIFRRIVKPFERDMNALAETLAWKYVKRGNKGEEIRSIGEECDLMDFNDFRELMVHINWVTYPDRKIMNKTVKWFNEESTEFEQMMITQGEESLSV